MNRNSRPRARFRAVISYVVLPACLAVCGSCASSGLDRSYVGPAVRPAELLEYYSYPARPVQVCVEAVRREGGRRVERFELPSAVNLFGDENIRVDFYAQERPGRHPTVLALPISGGVDFTVRSFADSFTAHGFNCAIVYHRDAELEDARTAEEVEAYFRQTVIDNRQVLDYLMTRSDVDPNRIGCVGLSLGAIKAAMVAAVDERVRCVVMGLAGGSLADITLHSDEEDIKAYIDQLLEQGIEAELIHSELWTKVRTDPLKLAPYIDASKALLFVAVFDRVVPAWTGKQLRTAIGGPETDYLLAGHYTSFLYLPYAHCRSIGFMKKTFAGR